MTEPMLLWGLGLVGLALLLLAIEVFIPSAGLISIVSGLCAVGGVVCLWRVSPSWGIAGTLGVVLLGPIVFFFLLNVMPSTPIGRRLIGAESEEETEAREAAQRQSRDQRQALVGAQGVALTDLRPAGTVQIDGRRYDALAQPNAIDAGSPIRVTRATMSDLIVRAAP